MKISQYTTGFICFICSGCSGCIDCPGSWYEAHEFDVLSNTVELAMDSEGYDAIMWRTSIVADVSDEWKYMTLSVYGDDCWFPQISVMYNLDESTIDSIHFTYYVTLAGCPDVSNYDANIVQLNNIEMTGDMQYSINTDTEVIEVIFNEFTMTYEDVVDEALPHYHSIVLNGVYTAKVYQQGCR